ncbi:hypothetical protein QX51_12055 [Terrisporobacter othiniensis]|uniref:Uncharacterized protein n=1 Tax=Terrisporobacter othiniensis TaxID=1577792 RepID=A0A0B3VVU8_9FIRM|nr:hypothetical protein [Terrisporobacter othiniensis]KHS56709.1 hypothetical protein QX51_12055 [Terrisporobacter othiniensis]
MNKFKEVFQFLEQYGGTSFIADKNKENYNEERYKNINNLKVANPIHRNTLDNCALVYEI